MKKIQLAVLAAAAITMISSHAFAQNHSIQGLAIGGSAGAIAGQAIGRNVESTIIGATIGGVLGAVIGSEMHPVHHRVAAPPPVVYHQPPQVVYHEVAPVVYHEVVPAPVHYRPHHAPKYSERCRETVRTSSGHYKAKTVVSTVCWNDRNRRPDDRGYRQHDRRWNPAPHHRF